MLVETRRNIVFPLFVIAILVSSAFVAPVDLNATRAISSGIATLARFVDQKAVLPLATSIGGLVLLAAKPATAISGVVAYVPITLTNNQALSTPTGFQELIFFNPSSYPAYEASDLGNVRFCADVDCTSPLNAWLEGCTPSCGTSATSAEAWVKLNSAIPGSQGILQIYMDFLTTTADFDCNYWGEAPELGSSYGGCDNGASIFNFYDDFAGTSLSPEWSTANIGTTQITVDNGLSITGPQTYGTGVYGGIITTTSLAYPEYFDAYVVSRTSCCGGIVLEESTTNTFPATMGDRFENGYGIDSTSPTAVNIEVANGAGVNSRVGSGTLSMSYPAVLSFAWISTGSQAAAGNYAQTISAFDSSIGIGNYYLSIQDSGQSYSANATIDWTRARDVPPNDVMPSYSLGQITPLSGTVTQPIDASFDNADGGSVQTITVSSCAPFPTTFAGDGSDHNISMLASCGFTLSLPQGYQFTGGTGTTTCPTGTCSTYSTSYEAELVTQPIAALWNDVNGGPVDQVVKVAGCDASPSSFQGDGSVNDITMTPFCIFTLSLPSPDQFIVGGSGETSCSSGTCPVYQTFYEAPTNANYCDSSGCNIAFIGTGLPPTSSDNTPQFAIYLIEKSTPSSYYPNNTLIYLNDFDSLDQQPSGSYEYSVYCATSSPCYDYNPSPQVGQFSSPTSSPIVVAFSNVPPPRYSVTFTETGLPTGTSWSIDFPSWTATTSSTTSSITFPDVANGIYGWQIGGPPSGCYSAPSAQSALSLVVNGENVYVSITFTCSPQSNQPVTQPIAASFSDANGGSEQTVSISPGCNPSPPSFAGNAGTQDITMNPNCAFTLSLPSGYVFTGGTGTTTCSSGTCTTYATGYEAVANAVTQPIVANFDGANGGSEQLVTVGGSCNPNPAVFTGDGASHSVTMSPSCAFTLSLPSGYQFTGGTGTTSCSSGMCGTYTTSYEANPSNTTTVSLMMTLSSVESGAPLATFALSGCGVSPAIISGDGRARMVTADSSCLVTVSAPAAGGTARYIFAAGQPSESFTTCPSGTCAAESYEYYYQVSMSASYGLVGGGSPTPPSLTYSAYGNPAQPMSLSISPTVVWADFGSSWSISNPLGGSSSTERWETKGDLAGLATSGETIDPQYYHQFVQNPYYTLVCASGATCAPVEISYTSFGQATLTPLSGSSQALWMDQGSTASVPETVTDSLDNAYATSTYHWTVTEQDVISSPISYSQQVEAASVELSASAETFSNNIPQVSITIMVLGGNDAPLPSVSLTLGASVGSLSSSEIQTNNQGQQTVVLSLLSPPNAPVSSVITAEALNGIAKSITVEFDPPSFLINVSNQTGSYSVHFSVDWSEYQALVAEGSGSSEEYLPQAQYLFDYVQSPSNNPIFGVQVLRDNPSGSNPLPPSSSTIELVYETLTWAYAYAQTGTLNDNFGPNSPQYQWALDAYNNEWKQEAGIVAANVLNYATIILPLASSIQSYLGSDSSQGQSLVQVFWAITGGYQQLSSTLGSNQVDQVLAVLEEPPYDLVSGPGYTSAQFLTNLAELPPSQYNSLISLLMGAAFGDNSVPPNIEGFGDSLISNLVSAPVSLGLGASVASLQTFTSAYFTNELSIQTSSEAATTAFVDSVDAGSADFAEYDLPLAIASVIIQSYLLPMSSMLQEQVNIQNLQVQTLYPAFFSGMNIFVTQDGFADVSAGLAVLSTEGLVASTTSSWASIDYSITQSEFLQDAIWSSQAQSQMQTDTSNAMTYSQLAYNLVEALQGMQSQAQAIVNDQDPSGVPSPIALNQSNEPASPLTQEFPSGRVLAFYANGSAQATLSFGNDSISVSENAVRSSYKYALGSWGGGTSGIVVFGSPPGTFALVPVSGNAYVTSYSINSSANTLLSKTNVASNETALFGVGGTWSGGVSAAFGNYGATFIERGLSNQVWGVDINNTIIQSKTASLQVAGLTSPSLRFVVYSPPQFAASPSTQQINLSPGSNTILISFNATSNSSPTALETTLENPVVILVVIVFAVVAVLLSFSRVRKNRVRRRSTR